MWHADRAWQRHGSKSARASHLVQGRLVVLQAVRLVDHQVAPADVAQLLRVLEHQLKGGDEHVKLVHAPRALPREELKGADDLRRPAKESSSHYPIAIGTVQTCTLEEP